MTRALLSPEAQLVLLSAGGPENDAAMRALVRGGLAWRRVVQTAILERAAPVLWHRLRGLRPLPPVETGIEALESTARVWEFKLLRLESLLHQLLDAFSGAGIRVVLLKGSGLALTVYGSFTRRPMADLDLLVSADQAEPAWRLAQQLGWRWDAGDYPLGAYDAHHHLPPLTESGGSGSKLDIHTEIVRSRSAFELSADDIWRDAVPVSAAGGAAHRPSRVHQLVHTCLHFAWSHHLADKTWRTFRDIWALSECVELDWDDLVETARACRAGTCCYWALRLADCVAGIPIPGAVLSALRPPFPEALRSPLERHLTLGLVPLEDGCPSESVRRALRSLALLRRNREESVKRPGVGGPDATPQSGRRTRLARHLENRGAWLRYGRSLLSPNR